MSRYFTPTLSALEPYTPGEQRNSHIGSPKEKIINFILLRSMRPDGEKRLKIKMEDLAGLIDETRINVSKELNDMQEKGLVELSRKEIFIPAMEKLSE